ncbi:hypothetical protein [Variovorax sp. UC122_21]|uniref:hypothetical protein n=1 Tax=Variovorax sp. UC122_21 TaxID=3374554 RepID=UPI003757C0EB
MNQTNPNRADGALSNDMPEAVHADGMRILWDVPIPMSDGVVLRADVFLPPEPGRHAALLSYGAYGKGVPMQVGYKSAYDRMVRDFPTSPKARRTST